MGPNEACDVIDFDGSVRVVHCHTRQDLHVAMETCTVMLCVVELCLMSECTESYVLNYTWSIVDAEEWFALIKCYSYLIIDLCIKKIFYNETRIKIF